MENRQSRRAASAVAVVAAAEHVTAEGWISTHSSASCPPTSWPGRSTGSTRSTPTRCWTDCSPPTGSRPSCVICWSPTSTTSVSAGRVGKSRSPRSTLPPTCCEAACSGWPAAGPRPRSNRRPGLPARRAARPRADRLRHHLYRRGWRIIYLGPDTPIATIGQATERIAPDLVVLAGTVPEPFAAHADAIADLARQTMVALGGAGATPELATRTGAHLLDQDPVSVAEHMDRNLPRSRHTPAPPGPA
jgi:hypothetical protein